MRLKKYLPKTKHYSFIALRIVISIASIFALFYAIRWLGIKGNLGFLMGMLVMAYLLLSKNVMVLSLINVFKASEYINEIFKEK